MRQGFKGWQIPDGIQTAQGWSGVRRAGTLSAVLNRRNGCARVGNKISMTFWCHAGGLGVLKGAARTHFQASRDDAVLLRRTDGLLHSGTLAGWAVIRTGFVGRGKQAGRRPAAYPSPMGWDATGGDVPALAKLGMGQRFRLGGDGNVVTYTACLPRGSAVTRRKYFLKHCFRLWRCGESRSLLEVSAGIRFWIHALNALSVYRATLSPSTTAG